MMIQTIKKLNPVRDYKDRRKAQSKQISNGVNSQKGSSAIQLVAVLATVSIVIGGVSVGVGEVLNQAKDVQRAANLRQLATALELYYFDNQSYPEVMGANSGERFNDLISQLSDYLASFPTEKENYDYQNFNSGQNYILKTLLENPTDLEGDFDNQIQEIDCPESSYCIKM